MRFYTKQHQFSCGIDPQARFMDICHLRHDGDILLYRNREAAPALFLNEFFLPRLCGAVFPDADALREKASHIP